MKKTTPGGWGCLSLSHQIFNKCLYHKDVLSVLNIIIHSVPFEIFYYIVYSQKYHFLTFSKNYVKKGTKFSSLKLLQQVVLKYIYAKKKN